MEIIYFVDHDPSAPWLRPWCYFGCSTVLVLDMIERWLCTHSHVIEPRLWTHRFG